MDTTNLYKRAVARCSDEKIVTIPRRTTGEDSLWYTGDIPTRKARALPPLERIDGQMSDHSMTKTPSEESNCWYPREIPTSQARALTTIFEEDDVIEKMTTVSATTADNVLAKSACSDEARPTQAAALGTPISDPFVDNDDLFEEMYEQLREYMFSQSDEQMLDTIAKIPDRVFPKLIETDDFWNGPEVVGAGAYWTSEEQDMCVVTLPAVPEPPPKTDLDREIEQLASEANGPLVPYTDSMSQKEFYRYLRGGYDMSLFVREHPNKNEFLKIWHAHVDGKLQKRKLKSARYVERGDTREIPREYRGDTCLLPDYKARMVAKPLVYSHVGFMRWVRGEASRCHAIKKPSEVVVPNTSAFVLMGNPTGASASSVAELLASASIQLVPRESAFPGDSCLNMTTRTLELGNFSISSAPELVLFESAFAKHRPLYAWCQDFLAGKSGQFAQLSDQLLRHVTPIIMRNEEVYRDTLAAFEAAKRVRQETLVEYARVPLVRQGNTPSLASSIARDVAASGAAAEVGAAATRGALSQLRDVFTPELLIEIARRATAWAASIGLVVTFDRPEQYVLFATTMVAQSDIIWEYMTSIRRQGASESDAFKAMGLTLFSQVSEFFSGVTSALLPTFLEMCGAVKFSCLKELGTTVAKRLVEIMIEFAHRVHSCVELRSLTPLFGYDFSRWIKHSKGIITWRQSVLEAKGEDKLFIELRRKDDLPESFLQHMTHSQFVVALENHMVYGDKFRYVVPASHITAFDAMMARLKEMRALHIQEQRGMEERLVPFCVSFYGPAGTAKTTVANALATHAARLEGRDPDSVYQYVGGVNFQTNFRGHTTVVRMDDPDKGVSPPSAGFEDHCAFIQRLVSSQPYPVEQADIESKGKIFAAPLDLIISTNHAHLFAHCYSSDPSAVWRRPKMYIEAVLNPAYMVDGVLDDSKLQPANAVLYNVHKFVKTDNVQAFVTRQVATGLTPSALFHLWRNQRDKHFAAQKARQNVPVCPKCLLSYGICYCDVTADEVAGAPTAEPRCLACLKHECECIPPPPREKPVCNTCPIGGVCEHCAGYVRQGAGVSKPIDELCTYANVTGGLGMLACLSVPIIGLLIKGLKYYQGRDAGVAHDSWFRAEVVTEPALPPLNPVTWTREDVKLRVADTTFLLRGDAGVELYAQILKPGWILFPTHVFGSRKTADGVYRGMPIKLRGDSSLVRTCINAELSVAYCPELTVHNGIWSYLVPHTVNARTLANGALFGKDELPVGLVGASSVHGMPTWAYDDVTRDGDCGRVLVADGPGGGSRIFGMHVFLTTGITRRSMSIPVTRDDLTSTMVQMGVMERAMLQGSFLGGKPPVLGRYPPKSEIGVAMTFHKARAVCLGTRPDAIGQTMKTGNVQTSMYEPVKVWAHERGIFNDYAVPEFRGGMVEDVYVSPYTHALANGNVASYDYQPAIDILFERMKGHYGGPLSEAEAIRGVPGEFNSINMKTSTGPPYNCPKSKHFDKLAVEMSPDMAAAVDEIEDLLERDISPIAYFKAVLKDEVLKVGKPARVFTVTSAAFNLVLKKYTAPLKRLMRASYTQSRCAVGLDCGSRKIEDLIEYLRGFKFFYDADAVKMDKSWTPCLWDAVIQLIERLTTFSAGRKIGRKLELLLYALKDAIIEIKGDLMVLFWNPSGNDITVELNSLAVCIIMQTVCLVLLVSVDWMTYGDDMVLATDDKLPDEFAPTFTRISGIGLTDGAKRAVLRELPFEDLSFLKRHFRFEKENGCWMAPLDESSIVKMLMFREKSALTPSDHEIALIEAALRYALLHGRVKYAAWVQLLTALPIGAHVKVPDFDEFLVSYAGGQFTDWTDRQALHEGYQLIRQSKPIANMSDLTMTTPANEQAPPMTAMSTGEDRISTATGGDASGDSATVSLGGAITRSVLPRAFTVFQEPAAAELTDYLSRWTKITTITLSNTNNSIGWGGSAQVASIQPAQLFFSDVGVTEKVRNFSLYRGDMEVLFVTAVPGNASGAYVISAVPVSDVAYATYGLFGDEQCMNVDNYVYLGMESSTSITMQLPYFNAQDSSDLDTLGGGSWALRVTCLSPLRSAVAGGVTIGKITVYARLLPGYKLMVPKWQGRRTRVWQGKRVQAMVSKAQEMQKTKVLSGTSSKIAGAAHMLQDVPIIGGVAGAIAGVADVATSVLSFFGFSRTNEQPVLQHSTLRTVTNVALGSGQDAADVAGFMPGNCISVDTNITGAGTEDPMAFEGIAGRWTAIANAPWSASTATDTVLLTVPITPGFGYGDLNNLRPTGAGHIGLPFEYWRADAEIRVVVPGSVLHRGTLQAVYVPTATFPPGATSITNISLNAIMDVSSATMFDYEIGYARNAPMLPLRYWNNGFSIQPIGYSNGAIQLKVVNPLVSQNPTDTLNVVVFIRFKNVQFAVPRTTLQWPNADDTAIVDILWEDAVSYQGKAVGDDGVAMAPEKAVLVPVDGVYGVEEVVAGESVGSLRVLAQRPSRLFTEDGEPLLIGFGGMVGSSNMNPRITTAALAGAMFTGIAASERIRVFTREDEVWVGASHLTTAQLRVGTNFQNYFPAHMPMTFVGPQRGAEFSLPYYRPLRCASTRVVGSLAGSGATADDAIRSYERMALVQLRGASRVEVYYSFGDDIRPGLYRGPPGWSMARAAVNRAWFPVV